MNINLIIDGPEARVARQGLRGLVYGHMWDLRYSANVVLDWPTKTIMLVPRPLHPDWWTCTGQYARPRKSQFSIASSSNWIEREIGVSGNWYLQSLGTVEASTVVYYANPLAANRGLYVSFFTPSWGDGDSIAILFGWQSAEREVSLAVRNDGLVATYVGTALQGAEGIVLPREEPSDEELALNPRTAYGLASSAGGAVNREQIGNQFQSILVIPRPPRELIIASPTAGGAFCQTLIDLPLGEPYEGTVTPAGTAWFQVPYGQACVQFVPLTFLQSGTVVSQPLYCYYPPGTVQTSSVTIHSGTLGPGCAVSGTLVAHPYSGTAFTPDGTATAFRVQCVATGPGNYTPYLYGCAPEFSAIMGTTSATMGIVINNVVAEGGLKLDVPDGPSGASLRFSLRAPAALEGSVPLIDMIGNRPVTLTLTADVGTAQVTTVVFQGRNDPPSWEVMPTDEAQTLEFVCHDWWHRLETTIVTDPLVLDGMNMGSAIHRLVSLAGIPDENIYVAPMDVNMPADDNPAAGHWKSLVNVGDTPARWLQTIHRNYLPEYYMGFRPGTAGPFFYCVSPEDVGTLPMAIVTTDGTAGYAARSFSAVQPAVLANEIIVEGMEPGSRERLVARAYLPDSFDPSTDPGSRPYYWLGENRVAIYQNPNLPTREDCAIVASKLLDRLSRRPQVAELECDLLLGLNGVPLWKGDVVQVDGALYRIQSLSVDFQLVGAGMEIAPGLDHWIEARYVLEAIV